MSKKKKPDPMTAATRAGDIEGRMAAEEARIRAAIDVTDSGDGPDDAVLHELIERADRAAALDASIKAISSEASRHKIDTERALYGLVNETSRVVSRASSTRMALIGLASEARQMLDERSRLRTLEAQRSAPPLTHDLTHGAPGGGAQEKEGLAEKGRGAALAEDAGQDPSPQPATASGAPRGGEGAGGEAAHGLTAEPGPELDQEPGREPDAETIGHGDTDDDDGQRLG